MLSWIGTLIRSTNDLFEVHYMIHIGSHNFFDLMASQCWNHQILMISHTSNHLLHGCSHFLTAYLFQASRPFFWFLFERQKKNRYEENCGFNLCNGTENKWGVIKRCWEDNRRIYSYISKLFLALNNETQQRKKKSSDHFTQTVEGAGWYWAYICCDFGLLNFARDMTFKCF